MFDYRFKKFDVFSKISYKFFEKNLMNQIIKLKMGFNNLEKYMDDKMVLKKKNE